MTHDDLVEKVTDVIANGFCCHRAYCKNILDYGFWGVVGLLVGVVIAIVLEEAEKICRDKQRERKDAQSCADAIKKLNGDA
jgi:Iap family predicted aminopeptidase